MFLRITPRNGSIIAVTLLLAIVLILFLGNATNNSIDSQTATSSQFSSVADPMASVTALSVWKMDSSNEQNNIISTNSTTGNKQSALNNVPMLSNLIAGLEQKVAANPGDVGNQILLAQTYSQLGRNEEGISKLREIQSMHPNNQRIPFMLVVLLSRSSAEKDLNEALKLINDIDDLDVTKQSETKKLKKEIVEKLKNRVAS